VFPEELVKIGLDIYNTLSKFRNLELKGYQGGVKGVLRVSWTENGFIVCWKLILRRGKWGYAEHGAKRKILLFLHETSFKTCFKQK
jgi:hypothetical protein